MDFLYLFKDAVPKELKKNEVLHRPEEKCASLGYIQSGRLIMKKYLSTGKELFLTEFKEGEMFGELLVLSGENYRGWLMADEPAVVLELSSHSLNRHLNDPTFNQQYFREISERVSRMTEQMEILSCKKVSDRLILYLLNHCEAGKNYPLNITNLSEELDCSREALSRTVSALEKEQILLKEEYSIIIQDVSGLEDRLSFL